MKDYLKITISILLALVCLSLFATAVSIVDSLIRPAEYGTGDLVFAMKLIWGAAFSGYILFGILGAGMWYWFCQLLVVFKISHIRQHVYSASFSSLTSVSMAAVAFADAGVYAVLMLVVPVVALSLVVYGTLFCR